MLKGIYGNTIFNWKSNNYNLNLTPTHTNGVLVETCENFKISPAPITKEAIKKTHLISFSHPDQYTNNKYCFVADKMDEGQTSEDIKEKTKARIYPEDIE